MCAREREKERGGEGERGCVQWLWTWINAHTKYSFSDSTFTQGLKIMRKKLHSFVFYTLVPLKISICPMPK